MPVKSVADISDPRYVKALSHPLRVRILALLEERTASPRELDDWLDATLGTVSYHVRALHRTGLLELVDTTQVRGAVAHHYRARSPNRPTSAPRCRRSTSMPARRPRRAALTGPRRS
jgi:DNA-binding transcriptional ArsR family regulator